MVERDFSRRGYIGLENRILIRLVWLFGAVWLFALFVAATVGYYVLIHEPQVKKLQQENLELREKDRNLRNRIHILQIVLSDFGFIHGGDTTQSQEPDGSQMRPPGVVIEHR